MEGASQLWYLDDPPLSPTSLPASPSGPLPTMTAPPTNYAAYGSFQDWREPIHRGVITLDTSVCIRAMPPSNSSSGSPSLSSAITSAGPSANDGSLPSWLQIPTQAISYQIHHTAVPRRSPASRLSPRTVAPPSPNTAFVPQPMAAVPLTNQASPASATSSYITCGSEEKGTAKVASDREATGAPSRKRCIQLSQSPVWQFWNRRCNQTP
jgi:hypothetical protein